MTNQRKLAFCFTPGVSMGTFVIEAAFAIWTLAKYRHTFFGRLSALFLFTLGFFQFTEWGLCQGDSSIAWARLGYSAILFLPVMSLHLIDLVTKGRARASTKLGYLLGLLFVLWISFSPMSVPGAACTGRFQTFGMVHPENWLYGLFYFGYMFLNLIRARRAWVRADNKRDRELMKWFGIAYGVMLLPWIAVHLALPFTTYGIPSIMCGFAVLLAAVLVSEILPRYHEVDRSR